MRAKVAIVCCSFNLDKYIQTTINSILRQTEKSKQIIVADAASTDDSLHILSEINGIEISSIPDSGYVEGFWNGANLVNAKYLTQCCVSDGYIDDEWLEIACRQLDEDPELSLVWASPVLLNADESFGEVLFQKFGLSSLPENFQMKEFWMLTGFHFPEGNFVARTEVYLNCFPKLIDYQSEVMEPFLEFSYNFHKSGLQSRRIPRIANYGRTHDGQLTQQEIQNTKKWQFQHRYQRQILESLKSEIYERGVSEIFDNLSLYLASYFGIKCRIANASYMMKNSLILKIFLSLQIRFLGYLARVFMPKTYKSFV
jgi:glycosyltransferase involved in cell wall biosynthesis